MSFIYTDLRAYYVHFECDIKKCLADDKMISLKTVNLKPFMYS